MPATEYGDRVTVPHGGVDQVPAEKRGASQDEYLQRPASQPPSDAGTPLGTTETQAVGIPAPLGIG